LLTTGAGAKIASGQSTTASNFVAAPTTAQIAAAVPTDASMQSDMIAALTAQGYTVTRSAKLDNLDTNVGSRLATTGYTAPTAAQVAAQVFATALGGVTFADHVLNTSSVMWGPFVVTHPSLTSQVTQYSLGSTPTVQTTLTTTTAGAPVSKTNTLTNQ